MQEIQSKFSTSMLLIFRGKCIFLSFRDGAKTFFLKVVKFFILILYYVLHNIICKTRGVKFKTLNSISYSLFDNVGKVPIYFLQIMRR